MTRSTVACCVCRKPLGTKNQPSGVTHVAPDVLPVAVNHERRTTTVRCPACANTTNLRGVLIEFGRAPP